MDRAALLAVLTEARAAGFLGPGPVEDHLERSRGFLLAWARVASSAPRHVVDLGSGAGIPGLALALAWPDTTFQLLDGSVRRMAFVADAITTLGLGDRVHTVAERAEAAAARFRGRADLVVARGFGPAAVTAECGAPFLQRSGWLAVSEPPDHRPARWPTAGLESLGLALGPRIEVPAHVQLLQAAGPCPPRFPRRIGIPLKRPLWPEPPAPDPADSSSAGGDVSRETTG